MNLECNTLIRNLCSICADLKEKTNKVTKQTNKSRYNIIIICLLHDVVIDDRIIDRLNQQRSFTSSFEFAIINIRKDTITDVDIPPRSQATCNDS